MLAMGLETLWDLSIQRLHFLLTLLVARLSDGNIGLEDSFC